MQPLRHHPLCSKLESELRRARDALQRPVDAVVYRCVELPWARSSYLVSGEGTRLRGSRWLRPGVANAVYASFSEAIALKESRRTFAYYGIKRPRNNPRVSVEIRCALRRVAALDRLAQATAWPITAELLDEDWEKINGQGFETLGQAVGRALWTLGFEGFIARSAADRRGRNLVWFPANLEAGSFIAISGKSQLDTWISR